jgi:hypothetical protein
MRVKIFCTSVNRRNMKTELIQKVIVILTTVKFDCFLPIGSIEALFFVLTRSSEDN